MGGLSCGSGNLRGGMEDGMMDSNKNVCGKTKKINMMCFVFNSLHLLICFRPNKTGLFSLSHTALVPQQDASTYD
jgi:hypothetical protein